MDNSLGKVITDRLKQLKKTQVWLAEQVGVSNNAVTKWIRSGKMSRANAKLAAEALGISTDELLGVDRRLSVNEFKRQLIYFFDGMTADHKEDLLAVANSLYTRDNPGDRSANPFLDTITPKEKAEK